MPGFRWKLRLSELINLASRAICAWTTVVGIRVRPLVFVLHRNYFLKSRTKAWTETMGQVAALSKRSKGNYISDRAYVYDTHPLSTVLCPSA